MKKQPLQEAGNLFMIDWSTLFSGIVLSEKATSSVEGQGKESLIVKVMYEGKVQINFKKMIWLQMERRDSGEGWKVQRRHFYHHH